ncbi:MAG: hypothetical protein V1900_03975 [Candidatus Aenigmatarchaeota archaeon]
MEEFTTIRVSKKNKERLDEIGKKADTHNDIISRLMDIIEEDKIDINNVKRKKHGSTR